MSAEYDIHAETESDDGGVSLAKGESDEMDLDTGSDTTPMSQDSGESSSSSANVWGEIVPSSLADSTEHWYLAAEHENFSASFDDNFHEPFTPPPFSAQHPDLSMTSILISETAHNLETDFIFDDLENGLVDPSQSTNGDSQEDLADQPNGLLHDLFLHDGIHQADSSPPDHLSEDPIPQTSTDPPFTGTDNFPQIEHSGPPANTSEDETAQDVTQNVLSELEPILAGSDHTDEPEEDWLALSQDSYNIFDSGLANVNGTLHALSHASNMVYYDYLEGDQGTLNSVSFFLYHWKQMYTDNKPDYPCISQLANEGTKVRRPDKIIAQDGEQCDYQGIHWSRFQTTKQEAREVRRMTYRNLRNINPSAQKFGTKAFIAKFPGAVIPNSDCYFNFKEMDMNRRPDHCHFQLRHMLRATSKNAIFYLPGPPRRDAVPAWDPWVLTHKTIACFNPETGTEMCAMDVNKRFTKEDPKISRIHTLTAGNGVLVAGSFEGVYAMKSLSADYDSGPVIGTIAVGPDVSTNHIHTYLDRQSGLPRVVFDSNDKTVRILDCTTTHWVACHKFPYQVNCSVTSPDGRLRLLNGDDCEPIVANAETGETLARLPGHEDYGFACDWAPDGITMATGHQDGLVKVWDARKLNQSIQTIAMEQAGCRSLQFSPLGSGKRVLVLAEPADFVHIVDGQTFESRQTIDFFGEISGISMPPDGSKLYIANADAKYGGLMEFDRSRDRTRFNRRPFRVTDLEDEHERLVDSIVDGVQPALRLPRPGDTLEQRVEPFMHAQGLPFAASLMVEDTLIDCKDVFFECLNRGGGQGVTASGEWPTIAETFGIPREKALSSGQQLYEYWRDNIASYENSLPCAQMTPELRRTTHRETSGKVASPRSPENGSLEPRMCVRSGKERQYRRDYNDPRRKGFKIGRKSESLDWLSESDMEHDPTVVLSRGQLRPRVDDNNIFII